MFQPLFVRTLTKDERTELTSLAEARTGEEYRRAEVVLMSAAGNGPSDIAERLGYHPSNVKKWIKKFNEEGLPGIAVRKRGPREGPKPRFSREQVAALLELSKTNPSTFGFERWTAQKLAKAAVKQGIVPSISHVTVRQMLKRSDLVSTAEVESGPGSEDDLGAGKAALDRSEFEKAADLLYAALGKGNRSDEADAEIRVTLSEALEELSRFEEVYSVVAKYEDPHAVVALSPGMRGRVKLRV
ncbi:MAG TPA: helix-turn-helix domain-containing protein, partial [Blastocatellia bacterium]|nr:helix-turn-helix domain-containing protein [Blastocatellia bacterium]